MGQLAVGLAGGALFGSPGYLVGMFIGGLLFNDDTTQKRVGPRRSDFRISSATRGRPIPEGFGTIMLPGEYIWASPVREVESTTSSDLGGKGGGGGAGSVETTNFSYFADFSVAFAQGPAVDITRVWIANHLVYDNRDPNTTNAASQVILKPGLNMRKYLGTEDQLPCPVMQATEGIAETPAHRGTVYITFEDFNLTEYGVFPQIVAEVAFKATQSSSGRLSVDTGAPWNDSTGAKKVDWSRDRVISLDDDNDGGPTGETSGLRIFSFDSLTEIQNQPANDLYNDTAVTVDSSTNWAVGRSSGYMFFQDSGNQGAMFFIDPDTLTKVGTFGTSGPLPGLGTHGGPTSISQSFNSVESIILAPSSLGGTTLAEQRVLMGHSLLVDAFYLLDWSMPSLPKMLCWGGAASGEFVGVVAAVSEPPQLSFNRFWVLYQANAGDTAYLKVYRIRFGAEYDPIADACYGVGIFDVTSFDPTLQGGAGRKVGGPVYDETDGNLIFWSETTGNSVAKVWKWSIATSTVTWTVDLSSFTLIPAPSPITYSGATRIRNGEIGFISSTNSNTWVIIDTISGVIKENGTIDYGPWRGLTASRFWDDTYRVFTSHHSNFFGAEMEQYFPGRTQPLGEPLNEVVNTLSGKLVNGAKLESSQYDTIDLIPYTLRGGAITKESTPRQYIENTLAPAFNFDAVTVNGKVTFVVRDDLSGTTINEDDLVQISPLLNETRTQEIELPRRLEVKFLDPEIDYEDNSATAQRSALPIATMLSRSEASIEIPIVLSLSEAKEIAERLLHTSWSQRITYTFTLGHEYYRLVPTNVITINMNNGDTFTLRIIETEVQTDHSIKIVATVLDSVLAIASGATADPVLGFEDQTVQNSVGTKLFLFDGPYLRDIDATERSSIELRHSMSGLIEGWVSGTLYESDDNVNYVGSSRITQGASYGVLKNALPAGADVTVTDETTVLQVVMVQGTLSSTDDAGYYGDVNVAAVGNPTTGIWENIIFRDVVDTGGGGYDISHIGRGRRGTNSEFFTETHLDGETFILLDRATMARLLLPLSDLNTLRYYKGVGDSEFIEQVPVKPLASSGGPLKPLKPSYLDLSVDVSDNVDVSWTRSTRLNYENPQDWGDKALNEDSELYEADILDESDTVVRTFGAGGTLAVEALQYDKADYKTDIAVGTAATQIDVGSTTTFTRPAGDFVTDGYVAGMKIETSGFTDAANNGIFTINTVASGTITIDETTLVVETGTGDEVMDAIRRPDWSILIYQISAQVGRGYASDKTLLPT